MSRPAPSGAVLALGSAALFGLSTPVAKLLVGDVPPLMLAGLLYLGSGAGLLALRWLAPRDPAPLEARDVPWLGGAILTGGVLAPVALLAGLALIPSSTAALLLNLEALFTALIAWFVFGENVGRRVAVGMVLIVTGGVLLAAGEGTSGGMPRGSVLVAAACLGWAVDNNLTQRVSAADPRLVAGLKGLVAGLVNVGLALLLDLPGPGLRHALASVVVGFLGYGVSLVLFVVALRHLGTARTGAYFSAAPFIGAAASVVLLHEPAGPRFGLAAALMAAGVWLHLTEHHEHEHSHQALAHTHEHLHDEHHRHEHDAGVDVSRPHTHAHVHEPLVHVHPHFPDIHHRHDH